MRRAFKRVFPDKKNGQMKHLGRKYMMASVIDFEFFMG